MKTKQKQLIGFLILLILIAGYFTISHFMNKKKELILEENIVYYNGFKFVRNGDLWVTNWRKGTTEYTVPFHYHPSEVEDIILEGELDGFNMDNLYITFNPEDPDPQFTALAGTELSLSLATAFGITAQTGCTTEYPDACPPRPIVTCDNTNGSVFYLKVDEETKIILDKKCITIQGQGTELVRAVDKILFDFYEIT